MTSISSTSRAALLVVAWAFFAASWVGIVAALRSFFIANREYGLLSAETFLDSGFGYYGSFAFAMAAIAILFAVKVSAAPHQKWFLPFKVTFFLSLAFLIPVLFSMVQFLVS